MIDYSKNSFYTKTDNETGNTTYYIKLNNKLIEVTKDVYTICHNSYQKQLRDLRRDEKYSLISYDVVYDNEHPLLDKIGIENDLVEDLALQEDYIIVMNIISKLKQKDRKIITELLIDEKTEKEVAKKYNVSQQAINNKKRRIIKKIKKDFRK